MKIAFVSNNRTTISRHFGRARHYVVITIEQGREIAREVRDKPGHQGHGHDHNHNHGHSHDHNHNHSRTQDLPFHEGHAPGQQQDRHGNMLTALEGCQVVVAGGMGAPMDQRLRDAGYRTIHTPILSIEAALKAYLAGELEDHPELVH